jgi:hypothetical protein
MKQIFNHLYDLAFGCTHCNLSRVFSIRRRTYQVCYDCGREFNYSLATMGIVEGAGDQSREAPRAVVTANPSNMGAPLRRLIG